MLSSFVQVNVTGELEFKFIEEDFQSVLESGSFVSRLFDRDFHPISTKYGFEVKSG